MEALIAIFDDYKEYYDRIYDLKTGESEKLADDLINFCTLRKWESPTVLLIISNASECNLQYLREYWELFKKIYNHFKLRPSKLLKPHIAALYSKEYHRDADIRSFPEHLKKYRKMEIDDILRIYEPSSKMYYILHDDVENFAVEMGPIIEEEIFNQKLEYNTLIEWCSYYGSLRCFRYLRGQGIGITETCLFYSFIGKNKDIIMECLVEIGETLKQINVINICQINDEDYLTSLHNDYKQSWTIGEAVDTLNLKAFLILASLRDQPSLILENCSKFGITEIYDFISSDLKLSTFDANIALIKAFSNNSVDIISKLIELGANIEAKDRFGKTSLHTASLFNSVDTISKLIELGANIEAKDNYGRTPLHTASCNNSVDSISKLIELGANIEAKDRFGKTSLDIASRHNNVDSISKLIELGANIEAKDNDGRTPLHTASRYNSVDSISKLIELGANIEAKDNDGRTALIIAREFHTVDSISKLIVLGADDCNAFYI